MQTRTKQILRTVFNILAGGLGVVAMTLLVRYVGTETLLATLKTLAIWVPVVFALEGTRIFADAWRTRAMYRRAHTDLPWRLALLVQLRAYPYGLFFPAGGAASEAYKATELAPTVTPALAAAVATYNQSLVLFAGVIASIPVCVMSYVAWGGHAITIAVAIQTASGLGLALAITLGTRVRAISRLVRRLSKRAGEAVAKYQEAIRGLPPFPPGPIGIAVSARGIQLLQVTVLALGAGVRLGPATPLLVFAPHLVGTSAGDLVPAQIGALDGAFALAASAFGVSTAAALSIPIVLHVVQLAWGIIGVVAGLFSRRSATGREVAVPG